MELLVLALLSTLASGVLPAVIEPILSQSQATGGQGDYDYSYRSGVESKSEFRTPDGRTQGSYSYLDSNGEVQVVKYTAGVDGFQVEASSLPLEGAGPDIPAARSPVHHRESAIVGETPEVAAARQQHAAAHAAALKVLPRLPQQSESVHHHIPIHHHAPDHHHGPINVAPAVTRFDNQGLLLDTPEVEAARSQHAAAHAAALRVLPKLPQHQETFSVHSGPVTHFDHQGGLVDTPEVAAARSQHAAAHAAALRDLPRDHTAAFPSLHHVGPSHHHGVAQFAEDVPRSALGETPEVAAAREAHLAVYAKVRADLPEENPHGGFHH